MSQDTSKSNATLGIDKKRKVEGEDLSKDYKKPKKLKQLTFKKQPEKDLGENIIRSKPPTTTKPCPDDMEVIKERIDRIITRQDIAQGCIERLLEIFSREVQEDSSVDEPVVREKAYKAL